MSASVMGSTLAALGAELEKRCPEAFPNLEARMRNLGEIVEAMPAAESATVSIDISEQIGEAPGTTVFAYRDPDAAQLFQAGEDGKKLSLLHMEMTEAMGSMVATMALAHVSPPAERPALLYAKLALKNGRLYMWLLNRFLEAFPHLKDLEAQTKAKKKPSSLE